MTNHLLPIFALAFYLASSVMYVRFLSPSSKSSDCSPARLLLASGVALHSVFIVEQCVLLSRLHERLFSFPITLSWVGVLSVVVFLLSESRFRLSALGAFVAPLGLGFMVFSSVAFHLNRDADVSESSWPLLVLHLLPVLLGTVCFVLAFAVSLALLCQEAHLKRHEFTLLQQRLPSLRSLDRAQFFLLLVGFVSMLIGVSSGLVFSSLRGIALGTSLWQGDMRFYWSLLILAVYSVALLARLQRGWKASRVAWVAIAGFATIVLSYISLSVFGGTFHVY